MKIRLVVNGDAREADVWAGESLLTTLRDTLDLPGSKNACEQGECGSCSVLLDGELVCACLVLAAQADGHEVTTVEGLRSAGRASRRPAGLRRCRRRPVRLLHARARRRDRRPARARPESERRRDPRGALGKSLPLHRLREDLRRRPARRPRMTTTQQQQAELQRARVGDRGTRHDATPKVTGEFAYSSDLHAAGMLWGVTVRSPHAHAKIVELDISAGAADGRRPRRAHARRRAGPEDVRPRVRRPARARCGPRPLLRRAGGARRRGGAGAGAACRRRRARRVRGARGGHGHGAGDRAAAAPSGSADDGARLPRRRSGRTSSATW